MTDQAAGPVFFGACVMARSWENPQQAGEGGDHRGGDQHPDQELDREARCHDAGPEDERESSLSVARDTTMRHARGMATAARPRRFIDSAA